MFLNISWHKHKTFVFILSMTLIALTIMFEVTFEINSSSNNTHKPIDPTSKEKKLLPSKIAKYNNTQHLDLFLKQLSRAQRFERNQELRSVIKGLVKRLSRINGDYSTINNIGKDVTVIFNAVNEIKDLKVLLDDLKNTPGWTQSTNIQLGLTRPVFEKYSSLIKGIQNELPNFKTTILQSELLVKSLTTLVGNSSTKYVMLTKKIIKFEHNFDIETFLEPLAEETSDIVSGSIYFPDGSWNSGCYQSKLIWSQYKTQFGFDVSFNKQKRILCDYIDGPFAMDRKLLLQYLTARVASKCPDDILYPEIQYVMKNQLKTLRSHPSSVFYMEHWQDFQNLTKQHWLDFAIRNEISEIYGGGSGSGGGGAPHEKHLEFNYAEAKVKCGIKKSMLRQRACMRDLHFMLVNTYKLFDKLGYQYTNEDGSGLAAAKFHDTIPWDVDQDFAFRAQNLTRMVNNKQEWTKLGMGLALETNKPCVKDVKRTPDSIVMACGYIGIGNKNWRMELWGQYILVGDFYQPWKLPKRTLNKLQEPLRSSRILGNDTKVRLDDHWAQNRPNPGYYVRSRYGVDTLRHAKHWSHGGASGGSMGIYKTGPRFETCTRDGYHLCMNEYLADGNIQFQRPWA